MYRRKNTRAKLIALILVVSLLIGGAMGGTIAWIFTNTEPMVNTFTVGNITLKLDLDDTSKLSVQMIPGTTVPKEAKVTVVGGSEACWLFIKITEANINNSISYAVADNGWTFIAKESDGTVYGRHVSANESDQVFYILSGNEKYPNGCVTISKDLSNEDMAAMKAGTKGTPNLTFTAYAIQSTYLKDASGNDITANGGEDAAKAAWNVYKDPPESFGPQ